MSCLQNEMLLESIFEEVQECFPYYDEAKQIEIAQQRFDDLCQYFNPRGSFVSVKSILIQLSQMKHLLT